MSEAENRAAEAWDNRYKHGKVSRTWAAIAHEKPERREVCEILANWMGAYEAADAQAERAFQNLAARGFAY
jgi:hypothetical protein